MAARYGGEEPILKCERHGMLPSNDAVTSIASVGIGSTCRAARALLVKVASFHARSKNVC